MIDLGGVTLVVLHVSTWRGVGCWLEGKLSSASWCCTPKVQHCQIQSSHVADGVTSLAPGEASFGGAEYPFSSRERQCASRGSEIEFVGDEPCDPPHSRLRNPSLSTAFHTAPASSAQQPPLLYAKPRVAGVSFTVHDVKRRKAG